MRNSENELNDDPTNKEKYDEFLETVRLVTVNLK